MANLFGQVCADFNVVGELQDKRTITSEKMKDWALYIFKVAAKGCTLEIQVTKDEYDRATLKAAYHVTGSITVEANRTKLLAEKVSILAQKTA